MAEKAASVRFEHCETEIDVRVVDRVWRTRSDAADSMTSVARTCCHLILTRTQGRLLAGLRGPETRATTATVPSDTEFLGIRFALGTALRPHPAASIIDGYLPLPVTDSDRIVLGGEDWEAPVFENVEHFVRRLLGAGLLVRSRSWDDDVTTHPGTAPARRTLQRRYRAVTGLSQTAVTQIDRANAAAMMLRDGRDWATVVGSLGYFDQAHLAPALRRYVGRTARELRAGDQATMSFLQDQPAAGQLISPRRRLLQYPVVIGKGKRLFPQGSTPATFVATEQGSQLLPAASPRWLCARSASGRSPRHVHRGRRTPDDGPQLIGGE